MGHGVTRKRIIKILKHTENLVRKNDKYSVLGVSIFSFKCFLFTQIKANLFKSKGFFVCFSELTVLKMETGFS